MEIDPYIANWLLDFLLRQPLSDRTLNSVLRTLPLPDNKPELSKLLLLKKLESIVSHSSISESALGLMEQLEEIEFQRGAKTVSDAMKRAYCSVAVDCTVKHLDDGEIIRVQFQLLENVKRVWKSRIGRMEKVLGKRSGLGSDELWRWRDELEAAVFDDRVLHSVRKKSMEVDIFEAIRVYVKEERQKMGPSFLELLNEKVKDDNFIKKLMDVDSDKSDESKKMRTRTIERRNKHSKGVKIIDSNETPLKVEVLRVAEAIQSRTRKRKGNEENSVHAKVLIVDRAGVVQETRSNVSDIPGVSLKDHSDSGKLHSRSPKRACGSRSSKDGIGCPNGRRQTRFWSPMEEDTLREGVRKYGVGNWKLILTIYEEVFDGRTVVDLKDKWRNMTK